MDFKTFFRFQEQAVFSSEILSESKQEIVNLGFPEIVAKIFYKNFGKLAFILAKWFRDYQYERDPKPENWWFQTMGSLNQARSLWNLTDLYKATKDEETYRRALYRNGIELEKDEIIDLDLDRQSLAEDIEKKLLSKDFFKNSFVKEVASGSVKDLRSYKDMNFQKAEYEYDRRRIFKNRKSLRDYEDGYRWIDVGNECILVGTQMKNCGSSSIMSSDPDRTLLVLFDPQNKPHVIVTYSPNEKRLSSEEGVGSTDVKEKYHDYVFDLIKFLGVTLDTNKERSKALKVKYLLSTIGVEKPDQIVSELFEKNFFFKFYLGGNNFYTDSHDVIKESDLKKVKDAFENGQLFLKGNYGNILDKVFSNSNREVLLNFGVKFWELKEFVAQNKNK